MSTSDGIAGDDWDRVHELTLDLVGARRDDEISARRDDLLAYLDTLEQKYGPLPSILATRADFVGDLSAKEWLLLRAQALAEERADLTNVLEVTHSLAELYIDERRDFVKGREQLESLKGLLNKVDDSYLAEEHERLSKVVEQG
jgi:hypothetical protein